MVFNSSLFDWNRFSRNLSFSGIKSASNSLSIMDASAIWYSNSYTPVALAVSKHRSWFFGFEITK